MMFGGHALAFGLQARRTCSLSLPSSTVTMSQTKPPHIEATVPGDIANLSVISFQKLLHDDTEEASRLFSACSEWGFFCLDLASDEIEPYRASADRLHDFAVEYFHQPLEDKMQDTNHAWETFNICGYVYMPVHFTLPIFLAYS